MLHHISIAVNQPQKVAEVLAEVFSSTAKVAPFPPHPGSYMVFAGDEFGTAIELYPMGTVIVPDETQAAFQQTQNPSRYTPFHAAISVPIELEALQQIGQRQGWHVRDCDRDGLFHVVEFWVENQLMLELLTPTMAKAYLRLFEPANFEANLAQFMAFSAEPVLA